MEPRCNHLGNKRVSAYIAERVRPQWSPGVITWETSAAQLNLIERLMPQWSPGVITWETKRTSGAERSTLRPQWSPGVITWETYRRQLEPRGSRASMEPRCNHLGNAGKPGAGDDVAAASMEPRCNHLGNYAESADPQTFMRPQWSPGVITWETRDRPGDRRRERASMEPRCNHLGNLPPPRAPG